jgi:hypothetical protein
MAPSRKWRARRASGRKIQKAQMQAKQVKNRIAGWPAWLVLMIGLLVVGLS